MSDAHYLRLQRWIDVLLICDALFYVSFALRILILNSLDYYSIIGMVFSTSLMFQFKRLLRRHPQHAKLWQKNPPRRFWQVGAAAGMTLVLIALTLRSNPVMVNNDLNYRLVAYVCIMAAAMGGMLLSYLSVDQSPQPPTINNRKGSTS